MAVPAVQVAGGAVEGRSVMYLYVLGGPRNTMRRVGGGWLEGAGRSAKRRVVGIVGWNGPHELGTSRKRASSKRAE